MVGHSLRALWDEPRPSRPPVRVWRDWALLAVVLAGSILEAVLREDRAWLPVVVAVSVVIGLSLLWRRTHPLTAVVVAFGTLLAFDLARVVALEATGLHSVAATLVLPYALLRWGAGREVVVGLTTILVWLAVTHVADPTDLDEVVAGYAFFLLSAALGAAVRFRAASRLRDIEQAELRQRHELARDLHDTVGHHVSAIAIQAQAGRALAAADPGRALAVLATIEDAASRTLAEMRAMVGVLREAGEPELAPQPGIADVERLASDAGPPRVEVHRSGDLDDLSPPVGVALHRITQEAVTNARCHAREATRVVIEIEADAETVRLTVRDDGQPVPSGRASSGFGLLGMRERASLLGGTLDAGPGHGRGWVVAASLPRQGATTPAPRAAGPASST